MENPLRIQFFVEHAQEGLYLTVPFTMPPDIESVTLTYHYERHRGTRTDSTGYTQRREINIVDLGLIAPHGKQVGASGSDKTQIYVSETRATPGYRPTPLRPGEWKILLGAYKVVPEGVTVFYEISFTQKQVRLLKGDLHVHTLASDGVLTVDELAQRAARHGLDFLAITDHNQFVSADSLPPLPDLTLIPGVEWTHFKGHANFLGSENPYDEPFYANTPEEIRARFDSASQRGALITINHPCDDVCPFQFDLNSLPFDCLEIWNGPMRPANLMAIGLWHGMLMGGEKVPICGGSDYHRDHLFIMPGGPTTCVYAMSASPADILAGLKQGHAYLKFAPDGPDLSMKAGDVMMGDSVSFSNIRDIAIKVDGLASGDVLQVVTSKGSTPLLKADTAGRFEGSYVMDEPGFARIEVLRNFIPGVPPLPALLSNPIYFDPG
jgi:hypothetical protein